MHKVLDEYDGKDVITLAHDHEHVQVTITPIGKAGGPRSVYITPAKARELAHALTLESLQVPSPVDADEIADMTCPPGGCEVDMREYACDCGEDHDPPMQERGEYAVPSERVFAYYAALRMIEEGQKAYPKVCRAADKANIIESARYLMGE